MAPLDPHSFADASQPFATHVSLTLYLDFATSTILGSALLTLSSPHTGPLTLDTPLPLKPFSPYRLKTPITTTVPQTPAATNHPALEPLKRRVIGLADSGRLDDALSALDLMARRGVPADLVTYSVILRASASPPRRIRVTSASHPRIRVC